MAKIINEKEVKWKKTKEILYWIAVTVGAVASITLICGIIIELLKWA